MRPDCTYILNGKSLTFQEFRDAVAANPTLMDKYAPSTVGRKLDSEAKIKNNENSEILDSKLFPTPDATRIASASASDSAQAFLGGSLRSGGAEQGYNSGKEDIVQWAKDNGRLIARLPFRLGGAKDVGESEHHVSYDAASGRWIKITKGGGDKFGNTLDLRGKTWSLGRATAAQYLTRLDISNEVFGDDVRLHGVFQDKYGNTNIITSQPDVKGDAPAEGDVAAAMDKAGFDKFDSSAFYRASDNLLVLDLHDENAYLVNGGVQIFDAAVLHPTPEQLKILREQGVLPEAKATFADQGMNSEAAVLNLGLPIATQEEISRFNELTKDFAGDIEAFKAANPTEYAELEKMRADVLGRAGFTIEAWHATNGTFTEFLGSMSNNGGAWFFADSPEASDAMLRFRSEGVSPKYNLHTFLNLKNPQHYANFWNDFQDEDRGARIAEIRRGGYDGAIIGEDAWMDSDSYGPTANGKQYIVLGSSQIKSADPLALDEDGKLITPDQWAQQDNPDIRYSEAAVPATPASVTARSLLNTWFGKGEEAPREYVTDTSTFIVSEDGHVDLTFSALKLAGYKWYYTKLYTMHHHSGDPVVALSKDGPRLTDADLIGDYGDHAYWNWDRLDSEGRFHSDIQKVEDKYAKHILEAYEMGDPRTSGFLSEAAVPAREDSRYLDLAKDPESNREELQGMVDAAAKAAGGIGVFHSGDIKGNVIDVDKRVRGAESERRKGTFYGTTSENVARSYSGKLNRMFFFLSNPFRISTPKNRPASWTGKTAVITPIGPTERKSSLSIGEAIDRAKNNGYDGVVYGNIVDTGAMWGYTGSPVGDTVVAFNPEQIKSAAPVTFDDQGNVIPLSQRFNSESPSILYSEAAVPSLGLPAAIEFLSSQHPNGPAKGASRILIDHDSAAPLLRVSPDVDGVVPETTRPELLRILALADKLILENTGKPQGPKLNGKKGGFQWRTGPRPGNVRVGRVKFSEFLSKYWEWSNPNSEEGWDNFQDTRGINRLSKILAYEAAFALSKDGSGLGWYEERISEMYDVFEKNGYPEIANRNSRENFVFTVILAATSNGQDVLINMDDALRIYDDWKSAGSPIELPTDFVASRTERLAGMRAGVKRVNDLVAKLGSWEKARGFMENKMTVADMKAATGTGLAGEHTDQEVIGAMILGPKIGSFWGNLRGYFNSITMDLWFTRTMNRISGDLGILDPNALAVQIERFSQNAVGLSEEVQEEIRYFQKAMLKPDSSDNVWVSIPGDVRSEIPALYDLLRTTSNTYAAAKWTPRTPMNIAAKTAVELIDGNKKGAPDNGSHRKWMRQVAEATQAILRKNNIHISNADLQAILWFHEKDLYIRFGATTKRGERTDYAVAAQKVIDSRPVKTPSGAANTSGQVIANPAGAVRSKDEGQLRFFSEGAVPAPSSLSAAIDAAAAKLPTTSRDRQNLPRVFDRSSALYTTALNQAREAMPEPVRRALEGKVYLPDKFADLVADAEDFLEANMFDGTPIEDVAYMVDSPLYNKGMTEQQRITVKALAAKRMQNAWVELNKMITAGTADYGQIMLADYYKAVMYPLMGEVQESLSSAGSVLTTGNLIARMFNTAALVPIGYKWPITKKQVAVITATPEGKAIISAIDEAKDEAVETTRDRTADVVGKVASIIVRKPRKAGTTATEEAAPTEEELSEAERIASAMSGGSAYFPLNEIANAQVARIVKAMEAAGTPADPDLLKLLERSVRNQVTEMLDKAMAPEGSTDPKAKPAKLTEEELNAKLEDLLSTADLAEAAFNEAVRELTATNPDAAAALKGVVFEPQNLAAIQKITRQLEVFAKARYQRAMPVTERVKAGVVASEVKRAMDSLKSKVGAENHAAIDALYNDVRKMVANQLDRWLADFGPATAPATAPTDAQLVRKFSDIWQRAELAEDAFNRTVAELRKTDPLLVAKLEGVKFDASRISETRRLVQSMVKFSDEIYRSLADKNMTRAKLRAIVAAGVGDGMSSEIADKVADAIVSVYEEELREATSRKLRALAVSNTKAASKLGTPIITRLIQAANLGALAEEQFYNILAPKFGLPVWNEETARKLDDALQDIQRLPEDSLQRDEAVARIMGEIARAHRDAAVGLEKLSHLADVLSSFWVAGLLSGVPTHIVNAASTGVSVFLENLAQATGYFWAAKKGGATTSEALAFYGDFGTAMRAAFGAHGEGLSSSKVGLELGAALFHGVSRIQSEKGSNLAVLEQWVWKKNPANIKEIWNNWLSLYKHVGRAMLAADTVNSVVANDAVLLMRARFEAMESGLSGKALADKLDTVLDQSSDVRAKATAQAKEEFTRGDFSVALPFGNIGTPVPPKVMMARRIEQLVERELYSADDIKFARAFAARATFNADNNGLIGMIADIIGQVNNKIGVSKVIFPFVRTLANLTNNALDYSPYGFARAHNFSLAGVMASRFHPDSMKGKEYMRFVRTPIDLGSPEYFAQNTRAAFGTAAMLALLGLALKGLDDERKGKKADFEITASGPADFAQRRALLSSGWKPNSIRIGGLRMIWSDWPALNMVLAVLGSHSDALRYNKLGEKEVGEQLVVASLGITKALMDRSMMSGAANLFRAAGGGPQSVSASKQLISSAVGGFTNPSALRWIRASFDPQGLPEASTTYGWLASMTPAAIINDRPALNVFGQPISMYPWEATTKRFGSISEIISPDPVLSPLIQAGLFVPVARRTKLTDPYTMKPRAMDSDEFYDYAEVYGKTVGKMLSPAMAQGLAKLPREAAEKYLDDVVRKAARDAAGLSIQLRWGKSGA